MYGVNNVKPSPFNYGKKSQPPVQPEHEPQKPAEEKNQVRKDEILFSSVSRKDESYLSSLSDEAKEYLSKLKEMYPDYDFIIADFKTDEDASRLLSQGKGSINVLITPDLLERMATDEATRNQYEEVIAGAAGQFEEINENLTDEAKSLVKSLGISIDSDGNVSFIARLINGERAEDGSKTIKSGLISDFADMLNKMAEERAKRIEESKDNKPPHVGKKHEESTLPPKSYEKLKKEEKPFVKEKDFGTMPPKSFEKYKKEENFYDRKKEPGNLPPESFEKLKPEPKPHEVKEDHKEPHRDMNFKV